MPDYADYNDPGATATAIGATNLTGTGLAKESGGNLDTHTTLLAGTATGALISGAGRTVGQEMAALIASGSAAGVAGGTPLLHGHNQLLAITNQVINPSANFTPANIVFTKPSYAIRITAQMAAGGSVTPTLKVHLQWRSSFTGTGDVDEQIWYLPAGGGSAQRTNLKGPVLGDTLNVTFSNGDAVNTCTINVNVYEGTFPATRHDGRSASAVAGSGFTAGQNAMPALAVMNDSFSVPGASTSIKSMPLYAGQVNIWINQNVAGGSQVSIVPTGLYDIGGSGPNDIASLDWTQGPHQQISVILPRCWCTAQFTNNAAGAQIATIGITAVEFAS